MLNKDNAAPVHEESALHYLYSTLDSIDFSADLLQHVSEHLTVLPMDDVSWSDARNPERMQEILHRGGPAARRMQLDLAAQEL